MLETDRPTDGETGIQKDRGLPLNLISLRGGAFTTNDFCEICMLLLSEYPISHAMLLLQML